MRTPALLAVPAVALALLLNGCVGTGPNTTQGAATGGILGAIAGGMIAGAQTCGDPVAGAIIGGTLGAMAGGAIGNSIDQKNGTVYGYGYPVAAYPATYQAQPVQSGPPPTPAPHEADVVTPSPAANALWVPGYWDYKPGGYVWTPGHWELPPPNTQHYIAAHWENRSGGYAFVGGYWQ